jgi:hypothetical protein
MFTKRGYPTMEPMNLVRQLPGELADLKLQKLNLQHLEDL